ncbi:hypothetical protein SAMN05660226_00748 [Parapedobacter luteus]|uniref:Uncharacterized protein n=1 Tax=Parapedobacter luteus TaxID=623280 RepID=A0A1T5AGV3_9SPHI|nr:hypothetical protein SAMN05660226_00748 [Parapedobacter luteus]
MFVILLSQVISRAILFIYVTTCKEFLVYLLYLGAARLRCSNVFFDILDKLT